MKLFLSFHFSHQHKSIFARDQNIFLPFRMIFRFDFCFFVFLNFNFTISAKVFHQKSIGKRINVEQRTNVSFLCSFYHNPSDEIVKTEWKTIRNENLFFFFFLTVRSDRSVASSEFHWKFSSRKNDSLAAALSQHSIFDDDREPIHNPTESRTNQRDFTKLFDHFDFDKCRLFGSRFLHV